MCGRVLGSRSRFVLLLAIVYSLVGVSPLRAQSGGAASTPYATLDRQAVTYRGPEGAAGKDSHGENDVIGVMLPLQGPQKAEGASLLAAVQVALEQEQARGPLPDGRKLALAVRDESGPWGQASSEILKLLEQDHALVVLTSTDGSIAHQAEQIANKITFPILTLASDPATTATNVPWLFRVGPSDTDQARAFGQRVYAELQLRKILLIVTTNHDGRTGRSEFEKVARELKGRAPDVLELTPSTRIAEAVAGAIQTNAPDVVVVWTDATAAEEVVSAVRAAKRLLPIFLSTKAAQMETQSLSPSLCIASLMEEQKIGETFTVVSLPAQTEGMRADFERAYRAHTGAAPGIAAFQAYEAMRLISEAIRTAGPNRTFLRDYLAKDGKFHSLASTTTPFDPAGNDTEEFTIVPVAQPAAHAAVQ